MDDELLSHESARNHLFSLCLLTRALCYMKVGRAWLCVMSLKCVSVACNQRHAPVLTEMRAQLSRRVMTSGLAAHQKRYFLLIELKTSFYHVQAETLRCAVTWAGGVCRLLF